MKQLKRARGFVLVVCVICSVAMVAIAMALVFTAGSNKMVAAKGASIDESESIAIAGMERSVAYAERVADVERDFDKLLDPALSISCVAATAADTLLGTSGLPRFTDGDVVVVDGKSFRRVPYGRGAYLIRFDDDVDDTVVNAAWAPFTNNHTANGCDEGPGASGFPGVSRTRSSTAGASTVSTRSSGRPLRSETISPGESQRTGGPPPAVAVRTRAASCPPGSGKPMTSMVSPPSVQRCPWVSAQPSSPEANRATGTCPSSASSASRLPHPPESGRL